MDEAHKKAQATREANKAKQAAMKAEREADKALVLEAMRAVLKDPEATSAQRVYAVAVLNNVQYFHFVPAGVKYPGQEQGVDLTRFKEELDKLK